MGVGDFLDSPKVLSPYVVTSLAALLQEAQGIFDGMLGARF